jgi:hypothetical protein
MFSIKTGHAASKIISDQTVIYCNTQRKGSLIHEGRNDWEAMNQRFDVDYRAARYILDAGKGHLLDTFVAERWLALAHIDHKKARKLLPLFRKVSSCKLVRRTRAKLFLERIVHPFRKV